MRVSISNRLNKLEAGARAKNFIAWAMLKKQDDGRFAFGYPQNLRGKGSFTEADFDMLHDKYNICTLIINDR